MIPLTVRQSAGPHLRAALQIPRAAVRSTTRESAAEFPLNTAADFFVSNRRIRARLGEVLIMSAIQTQ